MEDNVFRLANKCQSCIVRLIEKKASLVRLHRIFIYVFISSSTSHGCNPQKTYHLQVMPQCALGQWKSRSAARASNRSRRPPSTRCRRTNQSIIKAGDWEAVVSQCAMPTARDLDHRRLRRLDSWFLWLYRCILLSFRPPALRKLTKSATLMEWYVHRKIMCCLVHDLITEFYYIFVCSIFTLLSLC